MRKFIIFLFAISLPNLVLAAEYVVDKSQSKIEFSGTHAGNAFKGDFEIWDAVIRFDDKDLATSKIEVTIDTNSAKTGNAMYDGTLPTADWFDVKTHPKATFTSESITKNTDAGYIAKGTLTIRGKTSPVEFSFTLSDFAAQPVKTSFSLTLNRLAYDIGKMSDAKAEWVSENIAMNISLSASVK